MGFGGLRGGSRRLRLWPAKAGLVSAAEGVIVERKRGWVVSRTGVWEVCIRSVGGLYQECGRFVSGVWKEYDELF